MSLIPWNPFKEIDRDMIKFMENMPSGFIQENPFLQELICMKSKIK